MDPRTTAAALPLWRSVLAVVAHPDDESFGLGAVLSSFADAGARTSVLCFTRGEASTLHGVEGDLATIREQELRDAAVELGVSHTDLRNYPDSALPSVDLQTLVSDTLDAAETMSADGILVFDPSGVTGHPDHSRATEAALAAARVARLPVLGWTIPEQVAAALNTEFGAGFTGHTAEHIDVTLPVDRARQHQAVRCHPSQAVPGSVLWRRLELTGDHEPLRVLSTPE